MGLLFHWRRPKLSKLLQAYGLLMVALKSPMDSEELGLCSEIFMKHQVLLMESSLDPHPAISFQFPFNQEAALQSLKLLSGSTCF